jgi:uncharacterized protein (UPF0262 family)
VIQQSTGKIVKINIQTEITYSTTVVEFNITMAMMVLIERCNFVSADTDAEARVVVKLDCLKKLLASEFKVKDLDLYFLPGFNAV